ncbi:hypothetical protein ACJ6WF_47470 [Streptomyces sp. MMS24-I2-30]|uniref:hypothetical protein n=1 Tax=Streptomyces sp. MMS24-I2-30 TaxID=3351564 RepID=UPI003896D6EA
MSPESGTDVDGEIRFTRTLEQRLAPKAEDVALHWSGTSGWCLLVLHDDDHEHYHHARWLGAGLLPALDRVTAFACSPPFRRLMRHPADWFFHEARETPNPIRPIRVFGVFGATATR